MDRLIDERAATFGIPTAFDRPRIIRSSAIPLYVGIGLQDLAKAAGWNGALQELNGIVEAMLAYDAEQDAGAFRDLEHFTRGFEIGRNGLLHLDVFARLGADLKRLKTEIGERADIDVVDARVSAE